MGALTVFLGPSGPADGVFAALTDLSAAGLVDTFAWIADPVAGTPSPDLVLVENGVARDTALTDLVTTRRISTLRTCSVVPMVAGAQRLPVTTELSTTSTLLSATGAGRIVRIRAILTGPEGIDGPADALGVEGWHNIIVSPEDSRSPEFGRVPTPSNPTPDDLGRFGGPVIAALTGLWRGIDHTPLDDTAVLPGKLVRLARSFYRKLETTDVEAALRTELLSHDGRLPLPADQRAQVVYLQDTGLASATMAGALWTRYGWVLRGSRLPYETPKAEVIGAWAAITMFFAFLWGSLRNAPSAWYKSIVSGVSERVAIGVQQAVFTDAPAAYEVMVRGRRANGRHASWVDIGAASDHLTSVLSGHRRVQDAGSDLSEFWRDYAGASMTLADAGTRSPNLPPIQVGAARGIVREAAEVVPGPAHRFTRIPGVIGAAVDVDGVDAFDALGIYDLQRDLTDLQRDPTHGLAAGSTLAELNEWQDQHSTSFAATVGRQLATSFSAALTEAQQLLEKLRNAAPPPEPGSSSTALARWAQLSMVAWLVLTGLFIYLVSDDIVTWWWALIAVVVSLIVVLGALGIAFIRTQRQLFALLHHRKSVIAEQEVDVKNLLAALQDIRRLWQAYGQFLSWSRILGSFLAAPLGPDTYRPATVLHITRGLPMSTSVGIARPAAADVARTGDYLRRDLFNPRWLTASWEELIRRAAPPLPGSTDTLAGSSPLWSERGRDSGSRLDHFANQMYRGEVTSSGAEVVWRAALDLLAGPMGGLVPHLLATVEPVGGAQTTFAEFIGGIDAQAAPAGVFPSTLLTDQAITGTVAKVATDYRRPRRFGLGIVCAATQLTDAFATEHLLTTTTPRIDTEWSAPDLAAPDRGAPAGAQPTTAVVDDEFRAPEPGRGFEF
ncbi:MAG: hypothetical protein QM662_10060 [Gordonia sp. (in: high G+C Gram-positive bacteria)]